MSKQLSKPEMTLEEALVELFVVDPDYQPKFGIGDIVEFEMKEEDSSRMVEGTVNDVVMEVPEGAEWVPEGKTVLMYLVDVEEKDSFAVGPEMYFDLKEKSDLTPEEIASIVEKTNKLYGPEGDDNN